MAQPQASDVDVLQLVSRAQALGVDLDQPYDVLYDVPNLGDAAADLLDDIAELDEPITVGDLVTHPDVVRLVGRRSTADRKQLAAALAMYIVGAMAATRPPGTDDIDAWAREHGVAALLDQRLSVLEGRVAWEDRRWLYHALRGHNTLRGVFRADFMAHVPGSRDARPRLERAARVYLAEQAELLRRAADEEQQLLALPAPPEPPLAALHARVIAARRALRAHVVPRPRAVVPRLVTSFERDPLTFVVREEDYPHLFRTHTVLQTALPTDAITTTCSCADGGVARCVHALAALDALLERLADDRNARERAVLVEELARPAWQRALDELDAQLVADVAPEARVVWRVDATLGITPVLQRAAKRGGFSKGARVSAAATLQVATEVDREVAMLLIVAERDTQLASLFERRALRALVGRPNVTLDEPPHAPLAVRRAEVCFAIVDGEAGGVALRALVDGAAVEARALAATRHPSDALVFHLDSGAATLAVAELSRDAARLLDVVARRGAAFPSEAVPALLERLPALGARVPVALPPSLRGDEVAGETRPLLRLRAEGQGLVVDALVRPMPGGPAYPPGVGPAEISSWVDGRRVHARRHLRSEPERVAAALERLPLAPGQFLWSLDDPEAALALVDALRDHGDLLLVEWDGAPQRVTRAAVTADLRVKVDDRRDWFGLSGELRVDGATVPLGDLLAALRARRRFVQVDAGLWVKIGDELRARLAALGDHLARSRQRLEVSPLAAPLLDGLVDEDAAPPRLAELVATIRAAGEHVAEVPAPLAGVLRDYQVEGYRWLSRLATWAPGACLADDMGVGKTLQALALLVERAPRGPALVVAPTSVAWSWVREAARFTPGLRAMLHRETDRASVLDALGPGDVLVTSYGLLAREAPALAARRFATLVLDEAQAVKNPATRRARAACALQADFRLALTGTPVENRLAELWSLFRAAVPGLLGSWESFRERFAAPIERSGDAERQSALAQLVRPFILRRLKGEVARELPPRLEVREEITLSAEERALYEEVRRAVVDELAEPVGPPEQRRFQVLAALTRLRQLACHPRLVDPRAPAGSAKLERLLELVAELRDGGHRALIFSSFTAHLDLVREALVAQGVAALSLDGGTPAARRAELVDAFQRGEGDVFLISVKAGGTGLNLTGADIVIHLDPWWNPAVEDQASDRAHRLGQDRPVTIYRLVARDTVEEAMLALHEDKRRLVAGILDGTGAAAAVSTEELLAILSGGA